MDSDKRAAEGKTQRKVSHCNEYAKTVLTRNAGERLYLEKVTKHLDKEKTAKEAQLNHAQRLLLRRYGMQKDSDVFESAIDTTSASARKNSFVSMKQKSPVHLDTREHSGRLRSSSWGPSGTTADSFDNVERKFSVVSIGGRDSEKSDVESNERGNLRSKANSSPKLSSKQSRWGKTRPEINLESCESPEGFSFGSIERNVTGKNISEILPPFVLPPIYMTAPAHRASEHKRMRRRKRSNVMEHPPLCVSLSDPGRQKSQMSNRNRDIRDLSECRYLRSHVDK